MSDKPEEKKAKKQTTRRKRRKNSDFTDEQIREAHGRYMRGEARLRDIASDLGCGQTTLYKHFARLDLPRKGKSRRDLPSDEQFKAVHGEYWAGEISAKEAQAKLGVGQATMYEHFKRLDLPLRGRGTKRIASGELRVASRELPVVGEQLPEAASDDTALIRALVGLLKLDGAAVRGKVRINLDVEVML